MGEYLPDLGVGQKFLKQDTKCLAKKEKIKSNKFDSIKIRYRCSPKDIIKSTE